MLSSSIDLGWPVSSPRTCLSLSLFFDFLDSLLNPPGPSYLIAGALIISATILLFLTSIATSYLFSTEASENRSES